MNEQNKKIIFLSGAGIVVLVAGLLIGRYAFVGPRSGPGIDGDFGRIDRLYMNLGFKGAGRGMGMHDQRNFPNEPFNGRGGMNFGGARGGMFDPLHMFGMAVERLDLTNEQKDKIADIIDEIHDKQYDLMKLHRDSMDKAVQLLDKKNVTKEDVKAVISENETQRDEMSDFCAGKIADIMNILTDKQKKEAKTMLDDFVRGMRRF